MSRMRSLVSKVDSPPCIYRVSPVDGIGVVIVGRYDNGYRQERTRIGNMMMTIVEWVGGLRKKSTANADKARTEVRNSGLRRTMSV